MIAIPESKVSSGLAFYVKKFFGVFSLLPFEYKLLNELNDRLSLDCKEIFNYQLSRFNKVDRVLSADSDLDFCHTSFYRIKFGKNDRKNIKLKFNEAPPIFNIAEAVYEFDGKSMLVKYVVGEGIFFSLEYHKPMDMNVLMQNFVVLDFKISDFARGQ